jgi:hypothetical protein
VSARCLPSRGSVAASFLRTQRARGDQARLRRVHHVQPRLLRHQRQHHRPAHHAGEALLHLRRAGALPQRHEDGHRGRRTSGAHHTDKPSARAARARGKAACISADDNDAVSARRTTETCRPQDRDAQEEGVLPAWHRAGTGSHGAVRSLRRRRSRPCPRQLRPAALPCCTASSQSR